MLRGSLTVGRTAALPGAVGERRRRREPGRHRLCRMAYPGWRIDPGVPRRFRFAQQRPAALEPGSRQCRFAVCPECCGRRRDLFRPARHHRPGLNRRNPRPEGRGDRGDERHPFVHHDALRFRDDRPGESLCRRGPEQGDLFPDPGRAPCRCLDRAHAAAGGTPRCRNSELLPNSATAAGRSGCSTPEPARRCSRAHCSASSSGR